PALPDTTNHHTRCTSQHADCGVETLIDPFRCGPNGICLERQGATRTGYCTHDALPPPARYDLIADSVWPLASISRSITSRTAPCPPGSVVTYFAIDLITGRALATAMG